MATRWKLIGKFEVNKVYSVNKVCQFMQNPLEAHWKAAKRIIRYLSGTLEHGIQLRGVAREAKSGHLNLTGYCDAN